MNNNVNDLKKRTASDFYISLFITVVSIIIFIKNMISFILTKDVAFIENATYAGLIAIIVFLVCLIIFDFRKNNNPFAMPIVWKLRALAIFVILTSLLPDVITRIAIGVVGGENIVINLFTGDNLLVGVLGVVIGIISEIFVYGHILQDDMDSIA